MADDVIKTLIAEALAEGPEGMRRVAETILNRAAIRGLTPEQVVRQPHQYTGLTKPGPAARRAWNSPQAIAAAQAALDLAMQPGDPTAGADHYYAPGSVSQPSWAKKMPSTGSFGGHKFFASRPVPPGELDAAVATLTDTVPRRAPTQPRAADIDVMSRNSVTPFLTKDGSGVTDVAQIGLFGSNPDFLSIGSLPQTPQTVRPAPAMPRLAAPVPSTQSTDLGLMRNPAMSPVARAAQVDPDLANILTGRVAAAQVPSRQPAGIRPSMPRAAPSLSVGSPPTTRVVRSVPVPPASAPRMDDVGAGQSFADMRSALGYAPAPQPNTRIPGPNPMASQAPQQPSQQSAGFFGPASNPGPRSMPKVDDRLQTVGNFAQGFDPALPGLPSFPSSVTPTDIAQAPKTTRQVNPDYTKAMSGLDAYNYVEPDIKQLMNFTPSEMAAHKERLAAQQAAKQAPLPPKYIDVPAPLTAPTPVIKPATPIPQTPPVPSSIGLPGPLPGWNPVAALAGMFGPNTPPAVPGTTIPVGGKMAPVPFAPFAPFSTGAHPAIGLLGALIGPNSNSALAGLLGLGGGRAPVGSYLGTAANGGTVTQGHSGPMNSITQNSDYWKRATGGDGGGWDGGDLQMS